MHALRHRQVTESFPGRKTMPSLRHWQVTKSYTLTFLTGRKQSLRHWKVKRSCPVLYLPWHGASRMKQAVLSVRLKRRHRRGSAPMFIKTHLPSGILPRSFPIPHQGPPPPHRGGGTKNHSSPIGLGSSSSGNTGHHTVLGRPKHPHLSRAPPHHIPSHTRKPLQSLAWLLVYTPHSTPPLLTYPTRVNKRGLV